MNQHQRAAPEIQHRPEGQSISTSLSAGMPVVRTVFGVLMTIIRFYLTLTMYLLFTGFIMESMHWESPFAFNFDVVPEGIAAEHQIRKVVDTFASPLLGAGLTIPVRGSNAARKKLSHAAAASRDQLIADAKLKVEAAKAKVEDATKKAEAAKTKAAIHMASQGDKDDAIQTATAQTQAEVVLDDAAALYESMRKQ